MLEKQLFGIFQQQTDSFVTGDNNIVWCFQLKKFHPKNGAPNTYSLEDKKR